MKSFNLTDWALNHRAVVLFLILVTITLIQNRFFRSDRSDLAEYS